MPNLEVHPTDPYSRDGWNLNNLPILPGSLLRYMKEDISGMTIPWIYIGMVFSTFAWHKEDHYTFVQLSFQPPLMLTPPPTATGTPIHAWDPFVSRANYLFLFFSSPASTTTIGATRRRGTESRATTTRNSRRR